MVQNLVQLSIPFDVLMTAVKSLPLQDKYKLLEILEHAIAEVEEEEWERDPHVRAQIQEARTAYQANEYISLREYSKLADE